MANIAVLKRGEVCPMPNAQCPVWPMPCLANAQCQIVPHVTEKGYTSMFLIIKNSKLGYGI
jgi:hypothetical protein